jgi:hypothetical protein
MKITGTAYVFLVALVAAAGGFLFGFDLSIASGALPFLKEQFGLDAAGEGLAMSSAIFGSIAGPLAGMWLADRVGRRNTLWIAAACFLASAIGTALPRTMLEFNVWRAVGGIGVGLAAMTSPQPSHASQNSGHGNGASVKPYERLLKSGQVEIEALAFIRGRSIARRFFILDEAQQLTPHEVKTVITRISEGSKIVLIGDPAQIDNPYVDARSNGLVFCHNRMKGQAIAAHVKLMKGERSRLAELAADLL